MRSVLPGRPQSTLHAVETACWEGQRFVVYVSANALIILRGPRDLLQTIIHGEADELTAVAIDEATGKIATTNGSEVCIHRPVGQDIGVLRWTLQGTYKPAFANPQLATLSWGLANEVLLGGTHLTLLNTSTQLQSTWQSKPLANRVAHALFSHDASLIASTGRCDRLVKIWRRGFIGGGNERFDPVYLGHPSAVTSLRWRGRPGKSKDGYEQYAEPVLYTTCIDGKLRVWTANDPHCLQVLQLWAEIDMNLAIQPRDPLSPTPWKKRYVVIMDQWDFKYALASVVGLEAPTERQKHTQEHLQDIASRDPEIAIILDEQGKMSAWGLERVGCKARHEKDVVNIAHAEDIGLKFPSEASVIEEYSQIQGHAGPDTDGSLQLLGHFFDGRLQWLTSRLDQLLDPSPTTDALTLLAEMTGHTSDIEGIVWNEGRNVFLSWSVGGEVLAWSQVPTPTYPMLTRRSVGKVASHVRDAALTADGDFAIVSTANDEQIVFDTRFLRMSDNETTQMTHPPLSTWKLGRIYRGLREAVDDHWMPWIPPDFGEGCLFRLQIKSPRTNLEWSSTVTIQGSPTSHKTSSVNSTARDMASNQAICLDIDHARKALSCAEDGTLTSWSLRMPGYEDSAVEWQAVKSINVGSLRPGQAAMTRSSSYVAMVSTERTVLQMWCMSTGHLEHTESYQSHDTILDIKWASFQNDSLALAVAFAHRLELWSPAQLDLRESGNAWTCLKRIPFGHLTSHPAVCISWTAAEDIIVAAGSQLFVFDTRVPLPQVIQEAADISQSNSGMQKLSSVAGAFSTDLALYHPQSVAAWLDSGLMMDTAILLGNLRSALKYFSEGDVLSSSLGFSYSSVPNRPISKVIDGEQAGDGADEQSISDNTTSELSAETAEALSLKLGETSIPWLATQDRTDLAAVIDSFCEAWRHQDSVGIMGLQYLNQLYTTPSAVQSQSKHMTKSTWKRIYWASQDLSQEFLVDLTSSKQGGRLGWKEARESGMFMWMSDLKALRTQLETIAKNEYNSTDERNPIDCSLLYLALRKKSTLIGLWRLAHWHREQRATYKMLQNDFTDPRWRTAALKNAYTLLGKRRTEYAAAFFVLADELKSATAVLYDELGDVQLAVAVARAYEDDGGTVLRGLIEQRILKTAVKENNRWMAAWAFWLLGRKTEMLKTFIEPLHTLVADAVPAAPEYRTFYLDDPSLASTYQRVRDAILADPRGAEHARMMSPRSEQELVIRCCMLYMRMGCGYLALKLLRTFTFTRPVPSKLDLRARGASTTNGVELQEQPPSMLDGFEDASEEKSQAADVPATANGSAPARRKVAVEPSAASILDSFDF